MNRIARIRMKALCAAAFALAGVGLRADDSAARPPDDTERLQARIDEAWRAGGGRVTVEAGDYELRPVRLRSRVELHLMPGARIRGSRRADDYVGALAADRVERVSASDLKSSCGENLALRWQYALFVAFRAEDVRIVGEPGSVVDGVNCPDPKGGEGYRGPHTFWFAASTNIAVRGVTVVDSADYAFKFVDCRNVLADRVKVRGGHDGIHFDLCNGVRIVGCDLQTGDDCVAGSGCSEITVSNCVLNSACSPFRLGGRNVLVTDCVSTGPARYPHRWTLTAAEKARGAAPGEVEGRRTVGCFYQCYTGDVAHKDFYPGNIVVRNTVVRNAERFMVSLSGLPGAIWQDGNGIPDITFENVTATGLSLPSAVVAKPDCPMRIVLRRCSFGFASAQPCAFFGKNVEIVDEGSSFSNARRLYEERPDVSYDDIPEFPSWRVESAGQRAAWGLPPLGAKR